MIGPLIRGMILRINLLKYSSKFGNSQQQFTVTDGWCKHYTSNTAKSSTCFGGLGIRVAQMGFAKQATYWSVVDMHRAVMTNMCEALNRPIREMHPEIAAALAVKTDLLLSGVAVDEHAKVTIENEAGKLYEASPWAADKRAAEIVRPAPVQMADRVPPNWRGTWRSPSCNRGSCRLRRPCRLRSCTVKCFQDSRPSCSVQEGLALACAGQPCISHRQNCHRIRNGGWPRRHGLALRWMLGRDLRVP